MNSLFDEAKLKNKFVSKLQRALVLVCFLKKNYIKMTENKLKIRFIFKHNIQAHIQALKHTCKTVCCTKNTRHDK